MGFIKGDDVRGYRHGGESLCTECAEGHEFLKNLKEDSIITVQDVEGGDLYFCDRCKKQIEE